MSFYLEPSTQNYSKLFTDVIDKDWLEKSNDPNAQVLRAVQNDKKKPHCWRIMHRVTYVSRVPQEIGEKQSPPNKIKDKLKNTLPSI